MKSFKYYLCMLVILCSCNKDDTEKSNDNFIISGIDISSFPKINLSNPIFYNQESTVSDFLSTIKTSGVNTIRLRLWVNPTDNHSGFEEVKKFSQTLKSNGFKIHPALHYSDTWADPGKQETPLEWQQDSFESLQEKVASYTTKVMEEIKPDYIQIGNEINSGFLFPTGNISTQPLQFLGLLNASVKAVRSKKTETKIIIHFAGLENSDWFFGQLGSLDYDIIGLSYYPIWHGKSLKNLKQTMESLANSYSKKIMIAETAYPFTLGYNDWTNNIVGLNEQLILPESPASPIGQQEFIREIKEISTSFKNGIGFC